MHDALFFSMDFLKITFLRDGYSMFSQKNKFTPTEKETGLKNIWSGS